jgi:hypothetical protein
VDAERSLGAGHDAILDTVALPSGSSFAVSRRHYPNTMAGCRQPARLPFGNSLQATDSVRFDGSDPRVEDDVEYR